MPQRPILILLLFFAAVGCQSEANETQAESQELGGQTETVEATNQNDPQRKIIRKADLRIQVQSLDEASKRIQNAVDAFEGYVANLHESQSDNTIQQTMTIRVPADRFESMLSRLEEEALHVHYRTIETEDVSVQFIDLETRLATKRAVRERYITILREQAETVTDILAAEEKIRVLTEEIEAKEAQLRTLSKQINYHTVHLNMYAKVHFRPQPTVYKRPFTDRMVDSLWAGWSTLQNILIGLVRIWPILIILTLLWFFRKRLLGR